MLTPPEHCSKLNCISPIVDTLSMRMLPCLYVNITGVLCLQVHLHVRC